MGELFNFLIENEEGFRKARLPALYSDFRGLQTTNPDGYQANVAAWRRGLASIARVGRAPSRTSTSNSLSLEVDEPLLRALQSRQYGRPLALGTVVREAIAERDLLPMQEFMRAKESIYHRSWSSVPWGVVSWGLRQLGVTGGSSSGEDKLPKGQYVVLANLEVAATAFGDRSTTLHSRFERTWSKAHFQKTFADSILDGRRLSETDLDVLLKFMSRDKGLIVFDGKVIKVKSHGEEEAAISEEDASIASLKELMSSLTHQNTLLSSRVEELGATARDAVLRKNRVAALAALRSKKLAETSLERRLATLGQLEGVAARLEQASDNVAAVRAMQSGTAALASLNAQVGGAEGVEDVVERMREQMAAADEVGSILAEAGPVVDEGEIDDELAAMEGEERHKEEEAERERQRAEQARQTEETKRKLDELAALKPGGEETTVGEGVAEEVSGSETPATEAAKKLRKLSLDELPQQAQPAI